MSPTFAGVDGAIAGLVKDDRGAPQMGALVTLLTADGRVAKKAYTDSAGTFLLKSLFPGTYSVKVTLDRFLPALNREISVRSGRKTYLDVKLQGLFSSLHLVLPSGGEIRDMSDDWKWVLRTAVSTRPVLRFLPNEEREERRAILRKLEGAVSDTAGYAEVSAGGGSQQSALANQTDLGTAFAVAASLFGNNSVSLSGNVGYGASSSTPATAFRTTFSRPMGTLLGNVEPELSVTVRQLQAPLAAGQALFGPQDARRPALQTLTLGFSDQVALSSRAQFEYGFLWESVTFLDQLNYVSPYGRLTYQLGPNREIEVRYASGVPQARHEDDGSEALRRDVSSLGMFPRLSLIDGRSTVQRTEHYEVAYREHMGEGLLEVAVYRDALSDAALTALVPGGHFTGGNILPDLFDRSSTINGGAHQTNGYRVSYARKLRDRLQAAIGYGSGGALTVNRSQLSSAQASELRSALDMKRAHMILASVSTELPRTGTRIMSSYQWLSQRAAMAADVYNDFASRSDPGLNLVIRQPLPFQGPLPGKLEATADFRNLLKSGYIPIQTFDGGQMYLLQAIRSYRGALSFIF